MEATAETNARIVKIQTGTWTWTVTNTADGAYRTFRVSREREGRDGGDPVRFVELLTGPSNTDDFQAFGVAFDAGIAVFKTKRSAPGEKHTSHEWFASMLAGLMGGRAVGGQTWKLNRDWAAKGYTIEGEGRCCRCGRKLTTPESIEAGIGPVCAGR